MRREFLGLPIDALTMEETIARIESMVDEGGVHQHVVLNAAKVVAAQTNAELGSAIRECDLVNADGMAIVWAARSLGVPIPERVTGVDLFERLLASAAQRGWRPYFLGAAPSVVDEVARRARARYPSLQVAGHRHGYWTPEEEDSVVDAVVRADPDLLFVALPSPKKERFLNVHKHRMSVPFVMGVGGSFDVMAGVTHRAPKWMQTAGLEWLYRLLQEPRRMLIRYAVGNTRFLWLVTRTKLTNVLNGRPGGGGT